MNRQVLESHQIVYVGSLTFGQVFLLYWSFVRLVLIGPFGYRACAGTMKLEKHGQRESANRILFHIVCSLKTKMKNDGKSRNNCPSQG